MPPVFYSTDGGFEFEPKAAARLVPGFATLGEADAGVKLTANAEHACLIQMQDPTVREITNQRQVKEAVLARVRDRSWSPDQCFVVKRTRCTRGFAAVSLAGGQSMEFRVGARLPAVITDKILPSLELGLTSGRPSSGIMLTSFIENSTPAFAAVGVKRSLWHRLLPWRTEGGYLVDPNGKRFLPTKLPPELSAYAPRDRCYDPARSAMSPAELAALTVEDVFEEVTTLPGEDELSSSGEPGGSPGPVEFAAVRSFPLPRSAVPSTLAAADDEDAPILLDAAFEDGLVQFTVYDRGSGRYWLEVTFLRAGPQPSVAIVRYQTTDGTSRDLIVPVTGDGETASSSVVNLPDYRPGTDGQAWLTEPRFGQPWAAETVRTSVLAAVGNGTARAWERLAALVPAETSEVIERALRVLRGNE